ncbi:MAG TPA: non-homologous end-joining DNA ligase, partial [Gaiellaceae bacterium]|nr:non-homologous end-joining DNA ligase [Gaiellaceae bacterium]
MAKLAEYKRKRDPKKTPEPFGAKKKGKEPIFVVQRHDARSLHYDFRLERNGALASWAVPKGIPLEPGQRSLAVHVEDHPLEYATFEGEIPKGEYGAGLVEIWDSGTYDLVEEKRDGGLTVRLRGKRLDGLWSLVPAHLDGKEKNWLLLKKREEGEAAVTEKRSRRAYYPMLATLAREVPSGDGWLFEAKWDGYRAIADLHASSATLTSRNGNDLTARFESVAKALERSVKTPDCVLDGEVCALDEQGRATFSAMQQGKTGTAYVFVAFDLLELEGEPQVDLPLEERRAKLEQLIDRRQKTVLFSESFEDGQALYKAAQKQGLEGIVAKRKGSRYLVGRRGAEWLKIKTHGRQEFVIAGYTKGQGRRSGRFGALILGYWQDGTLVFAGNVGTGFNDREIDQLLGKLKRLERKTSSFDAVPKMPKVRRDAIHWVEPKHVAEIEFVEWTHDGRLRAPSYQGLREDKAASDVAREEPTAVEPLPTEIKKGKRVLKLSNLDKPFWPDEGITKGDLLAYYRDVASALVPHLKDRPFTMKRYPDGAFGKFFFQKDAPTHLPDWIKTVELMVSTRESPRRRRKISAPLVNDELALLWMVNMGCIDMNTW